MLNVKHKKLIIGITVVAVMSLGGMTALAASSAATLTPAGHVDVSKINISSGTYTALGDVPSQAVDSTDITAAASAQASTVLTPAGAIDLSKIDLKPGTLTIVGSVVTQEGLGSYMTAKTTPVN